MQRIFKCGKPQNTTRPSIEHSDIGYRSPFYDITYRSYKLLKMVQFWSTLYRSYKLIKWSSFGPPCRSLKADEIQIWYSLVWSGLVFNTVPDNRKKFIILRVYVLEVTVIHSLCVQITHVNPLLSPYAYFVFSDY